MNTFPDVTLDPNEVGTVNAALGTWVDPLHTFYKNCLESGLPGSLAEALTVETWRSVLSLACDFE